VGTIEEASVERTAPPARVVMPAYIGSALEGVRVAVVDDEPASLDLIAAALIAAKAEVRTCRSAAEAVTIVRDWGADVLIADIEMPDEDAWGLIRTVRAMDRAQGGEVLAIALTAYGGAEDRIRTLSAGFSMHIPKPIDLAELTTMVASLMGRESPHPI
jgi:CheY-like chemotaxis protein